ncbi:prolipoprotein diacylglyceryl transferase [Acidihalobacter prosperus]|uniref:Phosphatidylglycerol--prolipoprotein diacylglyceryl transferase n=1 Tax=Acidihalobacter prosperus TaxID=160660 RepID=A0A1A6C694_9GAMM|nr:prolipoprotein diacylglyceryl transferase [Acidihalobacter prosperus]OBS10087.1 prolipoprotein diacylglyceryl transferase [Acidihalobacter prosperus]
MLGLPYDRLVYPNPLNIDPVAFSLGPLQVHWYAFAYLVAFGLYLLLAMRRAGKPGRALSRKQAVEALIHGELGAYLGGRIGYVLFYNLPLYLAHPLQIFAVWDGGMSFHGGLIGVIIALAWLARQERLPLLAVTDFVAPLIPLGLAAGRVGNFINGNLFGRACHHGFAWCAYFPHGGDVLRYPSQLFEAIGEGLVLFAILWVFSARRRPTGAVSALFLLAYGLIRFTLEFWRQPDPQLGFVAFGWMTMGQVLSVPMIAGGAIMLYETLRAPRRTPAPTGHSVAAHERG